jgi:hypothetical protein
MHIVYLQKQYNAYLMYQSIFILFHLFRSAEQTIQCNLYLPIIVVAPCSVALTTASIMAFVPLLKLANSNTPGGL